MMRYLSILLLALAGCYESGFQIEQNQTYVPGFRCIERSAGCASNRTVRICQTLEECNTICAELQKGVKP